MTCRKWTVSWRQGFKIVAPPWSRSPPSAFFNNQGFECLWTIHNMWEYNLTLQLQLYWGAIKKNCFFFNISRTSETPLSIWMAKMFLLRKFWIEPDPPSFTKKKNSFGQNIQKKCDFLDILPNFLLKPFWIGWDPPPFGKKIQKNLSFWAKYPNKCDFWDILPNFLLNPFWIGWDPPPFGKKISVFSVKEILDSTRPPFLGKHKKTVFF